MTSDLTKLTESGKKGYKQDLHLALDRDGSLWAAWVLSAGDRTEVQWRTIRGREMSNVS